MLRTSRSWALLLAVAVIGGGAALVSPACRREPPAPQAAAKKFHCAMHPQVVSDKPDKCPICGMDLVRIEAPPPSPARPDASTDSSGRRVLYWYDPMAPGSKFDKPGKSPFMDMPLVPKYADEEPGGGATVSAANVTLTGEAIRATGVAVTPVSRAEFAPTIRAVGTIEVDESKLVRVAARVAGRIERLYASAAGVSVAAGQPLYSLYSPDLVSTQREYLLALENRRRLTAGTPEAIHSADELVSAARDRLRLWAIGPAQIAALEKSGRPELAMTFASPIDGTVIQKMVVPGQYVTEGADLYLLADLSEVWLVARVYEKDLGGVRVGQSADATVAALPGQVFRGRVRLVEPLLDQDTRSARVRIVLPNPGMTLKPGMYADAQLRLPASAGLVVPRSALIDTGTRRVVYVEVAPNTFSPRNVTTGAIDRDRVQILEGLGEGERVVAQGSFFIDSQAQLAGGQSIQWTGALDVKPTPAGPKP